MPKHPSDYSVILWDFDGVILHSNAVRELGFREVLKNYPSEQVEALIDYHNQNGGLSRYVKFRYFFEIIRQEPITTEQVDELAGAFSEIMLRELPQKENIIAETLYFIQKSHTRGIEQHIVSGSDQNELRTLCKHLDLDGYFSSIQGSPTPKTDLVNGILTDHALSSDRFCLIGDSINDYEAARDNDIDFFGFNNEELKPKGQGYIYIF